jgi:poly(3-hydroxybutyrate) depolymerase
VGGPRRLREPRHVAAPQRDREARALAGCNGGAEVEHVRLTGGKHIELLPQLRAAGVDPAATAWRFLRAHRLPAA